MYFILLIETVRKHWVFEHFNCSSSMLIKFIDYSSACGKATSWVGSSWPGGHSCNTKEKSLIVRSWLWQNQCYWFHMSKRSKLSTHYCLIQWHVCIQSIVADVQARHSSERSEQEEEELVTQAVTSKESKEIKETVYKRKIWTIKSAEHCRLITVKRK